MQVGSYQNIKGRLHFLKDSYRGGYNYANPSQSTLSDVSISDYAIDQKEQLYVAKTTSFRSYLTPHEGESSESFRARARSAYYINLVQPVVSAYVDAATAKEPVRSFGKLQDLIPSDVDNQGSTYHEYIRNIATESCISGFCFTLVDVQPDDPTKIRYIMIQPSAIERVITDDFGRLIELTFITQAEVANASAPAIQNVMMVCVNKEGIHILKGIVDFNSSYDLSKLEVVSSVPIAAQLEGQLPIVVSYYKKDTSSVLPLGISLVETQADIGKEVYNLQSYSQDILRTHFPQLIYPIKNSGGALTPEAARAVGTKVALTYDSETNSPAYISPSKDSTDALMAQTDWMIKKSYETAHLDLQSSAGVNSSGFALTVKSREFENAVRAFAKELEKFEQKLLEVSSKVLGIQGAPQFKVTYPTRFSPIDIGSALQNAKIVLDLSDKYNLGATAVEEALTFIVSNALTLNEEVSSKIIKEIKAGLARPQVSEQQVQLDTSISPPSSQ